MHIYAQNFVFSWSDYSIFLWIIIKHKLIHIANIGAITNNVWIQNWYYGTYVHKPNRHISIFSNQLVISRCTWLVEWIIILIVEHHPKYRKASRIPIHHWIIKFKLRSFIVEDIHTSINQPTWLQSLYLTGMIHNYTNWTSSISIYT